MSSTLLYDFICTRYLQDMSVGKIEISKEIVKKTQTNNKTKVM